MLNIYFTFQYLFLAILMKQYNTSCANDTWMCHDGGRCIEKRYVCDGKIHCKHGSDEEHCENWKCLDGFWKCSSHECIEQKYVCDGKSNFGHIPSCRDGSDEDNQFCDSWNCTANGIKCGPYCLPADEVCDGKASHGKMAKMCSGKDEDPVMCKQWNCSKGYWKCADNSKCLEEKYVCDNLETNNGAHWCPDRSESDPGHCARWTCAPGYWKCKDQVTCVNRVKVCDGDNTDKPDSARRRNCPDGSDEHLDVCLNWTCSSYYMKCKTGGKCVRENKIMDDKRDCKDSSDEDPLYVSGLPCSYPSHWKCKNGKCLDQYKNCTLCGNDTDVRLRCEQHDCSPDFWKCWDNSHCIYSPHVCDGRKHCKDKSDEHNALCGCPPDKQWPCKDGDGCINNKYVCNGFADCNDESDESFSVCDGKWTCPPGLGWTECYDKRSKRCARQCDGVRDCLDGTDEINCEKYSCLPGHKKCADNRQCIDEDDICNDERDCHDGSDELCEEKCLPEYLEAECFIGRRCSEDKAICFPAEKFCDGVIDCPLGSDEADSHCTCSQWGLHECQMNEQMMCVYNEWIDDRIITDQLCENLDIQQISSSKGNKFTEPKQSPHSEGKLETRPREERKDPFYRYL